MRGSFPTEPAETGLKPAPSGEWLDDVDSQEYADRAHSQPRSPALERAQLAALYLRVADTLERSALLAEQHASRLRGEGRKRSSDEELERAQRARKAAERGREHAARLRLQA